MRLMLNTYIYIYINTYTYTVHVLMSVVLFDSDLIYTIRYLIGMWISLMA